MGKSCGILYSSLQIITKRGFSLTELDKSWKPLGWAHNKSPYPWLFNVDLSNELILPGQITASALSAARIAARRIRSTRRKNVLKSNRKCNFPMNPHVRLLVLNELEVPLQYSYIFFIDSF